MISKVSKDRCWSKMCIHYGNTFFFQLVSICHGRLFSSSYNNVYIVVYTFVIGTWSSRQINNLYLMTRYECNNNYAFVLHDEGTVYNILIAYISLKYFFVWLYRVIMFIIPLANITIKQLLFLLCMNRYSPLPTIVIKN